MKRKLLGLLLTSVLATSSYASFKQDVTLCMDASGNDTAYGFVGHFGSSDFFDRGHNTPVTANGKVCVSHTYKSGPKKIFLTAKVLGSNVALEPDSSCNYLTNYKGDPTTLVSDYQPTTGKAEAWTLSVAKLDREDTNVVFGVHCEHTSDQ